ncbi:MAG: hypothetical protein JRF47_08345 [Deltaproteobacteria bacterium]|jgi:hypothetical protein|nr:hypothetical protein [Deltaproteobacteria bacterium]
MSKYLRNTILTLLVLVLILAGFMVKTFYDAGEFREIKPHFKGVIYGSVPIPSF